MLLFISPTNVDHYMDSSFFRKINATRMHCASSTGRAAALAIRFRTTGTAQCISRPSGVDRKQHWYRDQTHLIPRWPDDEIHNSLIDIYEKSAHAQVVVYSMQWNI